MDNRINIGSLDTLVIVLKGEQSRNSQGAKSFTYTEHSRVFANVDRRIDEQVVTGNLEEGQFISLTVYKIAELTTRWRVVVEGRTYEITAIDPIERLSPFCILSLHAID